jgi:hypothetical protein
MLRQSIFRTSSIGAVVYFLLDLRTAAPASVRGSPVPTVASTPCVLPQAGSGLRVWLPGSWRRHPRMASYGALKE